MHLNSYQELQYVTGAEFSNMRKVPCPYSTISYLELIYSKNKVKVKTVYKVIISISRILSHLLSFAVA